MNIDPAQQPPTAQDQSPEEEEDDGWLARAQSAYRSSTSYMETNYRKMWEDSIRAFNNMHPTDSKYSQDAFAKRSRLFRPKTRTVIRKNEAAAASAYFSNMDTVSVKPQDATSKVEAASAAVMKELLQHRLTKTIPWFQILLGGLQDAQSVGAAIAHVHWVYKEESPVPKQTTYLREESQPLDEEYPKQNDIPVGAMTYENDTLSTPAKTKPDLDVPQQRKPKVLVDQPEIELIPIENFRFDPAANWLDPVNSSPYVIHLIPMYVVDVKSRMDSGEWKRFSDETLDKAVNVSGDATRLAREPNKTDAYKSDNEVNDYNIIWVQRHIHRRGDGDWEFYCLGDIALLTQPEPLKERVLHGKRPYVIGIAILETHKAIPSSVGQLGKTLQDEANEVANQRMDNVKFVLNKKFFVKRGKEADIAGLVRNVPGGVVMLDDPEHDVKEMNWTDVTASAFEEQNRINMDMDELMGNFNPSQIMSQAAIDTPARNMALLQHSNGILVEYLLRTFTVTFVEPVLRQLVLLEQCYETDSTILALAGKNANMVQLYGVDQVTDDLLEKELTLTVNVGMGATDPMQKLQKFLASMQAFINMMKTPIPGLNMQEVGKEIFGHLGYSDGSRFFTTDNPQVAQLQGQLQQATQAIQQLQQKLADKKAQHLTKLQGTIHADETKLQQTKIHEENENKRALATHFRSLMDNQHALQLETIRGNRGTKH